MENENIANIYNMQLGEFQSHSGPNTPIKSADGAKNFRQLISTNSESN